MFSNRDIPPVLLLFLVICVIIATLSQILVVHNRGKQTKMSRNMLAVQKELREIDKNIESTVNKNIPYHEYKRYSLQHKVYQRKISQMIKKVSRLSWNRTEQAIKGRNVQMVSSNSEEHVDAMHGYHIRSRSGITKNVDTIHKQFRGATQSILESDKLNGITEDRLHYCPDLPPHLRKYIITQL